MTKIDTIIMESLYAIVAVCLVVAALNGVSGL